MRRPPLAVAALLALALIVPAPAIADLIAPGQTTHTRPRPVPSPEASRTTRTPSPVNGATTTSAPATRSADVSFGDLWLLGGVLIVAGVGGFIALSVLHRRGPGGDLEE